jgi:DNA-binding LacI/PurR family transcriptional regulator
MTPSISSINVNPLAMGRIAAKTLLGVLDGTADVERRIDTGFQIIERESTVVS